MKAVLIDPRRREIRVVEDDFGNVDVIRQYLASGERGPLRAPLCSGIRFPTNAVGYVDDDGCFREGQQWFRFDGAPNAFAGYMLILAADDAGDTADIDRVISTDAWLSALSLLVEWVSAENAKADFPATTVSTFDAATGATKLVSSTPVDFSRRVPYERID